MFCWHYEQKSSFASVKKFKSSVPVLIAFNSLLPLTIQSDSSIDGLGTYYFHVEHPISFVCRSLSECIRKMCPKSERVDSNYIFI